MSRARQRRLVALVSFLCLTAAALPGIGAPRALALPPTLSVPGAQTVPEMQPLAFTVTASDPEGQLCDLSASGLPGGASFVDQRNNTGSFAWTPDGMAAGVYTLYFTADDTIGGRATAQVPVEVTNANSPPVLDPIADRTLDPGSMAFLWVSGWDPDGDALRLTASGLPAFGTLHDNGDGSGYVVLAPDLSQSGGSWPVTVTLDDGTDAASQGFTVTVTGVSIQHAPVLSAVTDPTVAEGSTASVTLGATDEDGDALVWTSALPGFASLTPAAGGPGAASATLSMSPGYCAAGSHPATVAVSDGALSAQQSFSILVTDTPRAPAWVGAPYGVALAEGATTTLNVATSDPDLVCGAAAPALTLVGSTAGPSVALSFTDNGDGTGRLTVTAGLSAQGTYAATLRATDGAASALVADVAVSIAVSHTNRAPVADAGGPYAGLAGYAVALSGSGSSDPDGGALAFAWSFGDGTAGTGADVAHTYAADGSYTAVLSVSDGVAADTDSASVTVQPADRSLAARVWNEPRTIRMERGRSRERVYLEPVGGAFELASVLVPSVTLSTSSGSGRTGTVAPVAAKVALPLDHDGNGVMELKLEFRNEDLAALCSFVDRPMPVTFTLTATLLTGGEVSGTFTAEVVPSRKRSIRHVGPNPLNPEAVVTLVVGRAGPVLLRVYDLNGRLVRTLLDGEASEGQTLEVRFDGRDDSGRALSSGRYFLRANLADGTESAAVTILR